MLKAFIFDVDGTLLDTERIYMRAWQDAAAELGYVMPMELLRKTRAVNAKDAARMFEEGIGNGFSYEKTGIYQLGRIFYGCCHAGGSSQQGPQHTGGRLYRIAR